MHWEHDPEVKKLCCDVADTYIGHQGLSEQEPTRVPVVWSKTANGDRLRLRSSLLKCGWQVNVKALKLIKELFQTREQRQTIMIWHKRVREAPVLELQQRNNTLLRCSTVFSATPQTPELAAQSPQIDMHAELHRMSTQSICAPVLEEIKAPCALGQTLEAEELKAHNTELEEKVAALMQQNKELQERLKHAEEVEAPRQLTVDRNGPSEQGAPLPSAHTGLPYSPYYHQMSMRTNGQYVVPAARYVPSLQEHQQMLLQQSCLYPEALPPRQFPLHPDHWTASHTFLSQDWSHHDARNGRYY